MENKTEYTICCRCQGSGQYLRRTTLPPIGGYCSCPTCNGTGKILNTESFNEQTQEYLNDNSELLEAAFIAEKALKKS